MNNKLEEKELLLSNLIDLTNKENSRNEEERDFFNIFGDELRELTNESVLQDICIGNLFLNFYIPFLGVAFYVSEEFERESKSNIYNEFREKTGIRIFQLDFLTYELSVDENIELMRVICELVSSMGHEGDKEVLNSMDKLADLLIFHNTKIIKEYFRTMENY